MAWLSVLLLGSVGDAAQLFRHRGAARTTCEKFAFLRIQKTGSTTFEQLIPKMTPGVTSYADREILDDYWRLPVAHINYLDIKNEMPVSCAAALLRDPVERLISEFSMLRSSDKSESSMLDEDQWDFTYGQLERLNNIRNNPDTKQALLDFINFPESPSRNRQTLYLLGFERVACRKSPTTGEKCCGVCVHNPDNNMSAGAFPARAYDFERNEAQLLETAKEHLRGLLTFGIIDCFEASIRAMAPNLDWDPDVAIQKAFGMHERAGEKPVLIELLNNESKRLLISRRKEDLELTWSSLVDPSIDAMIRKRNRVDDELVKYAKQLFKERNGVECKTESPSS